MKNPKIRIESLKRSIKSKKRYLARKKLITRRLKYLKKRYKDSEKNKKISYFVCIKFWEKELEILNSMYVYYKNRGCKHEKE